MTDPESIRNRELARATVAALDAFADATRRLAAAETEGHTRDRRVSVRVTAAGDVIRVRLHDDALRGYGPAALGAVVARTLRATQQRARAAYERDVAELIPHQMRHRLLNRDEADATIARLGGKLR